MGLLKKVDLFQEGWACIVLLEVADLCPKQRLMCRSKSKAAAYYYHRPAYPPQYRQIVQRSVFIVSNRQRTAPLLPRPSSTYQPRTPHLLQHLHLQQPNDGNKRPSPSSQHRQSSSRSARLVIATASGAGRRVNSRPSSTCRRPNLRPSVASGRPNSLRSAPSGVGRRRVGRENRRASESGSLVLVVGVVVEVGRGRGVDARDHRAGGGRSDAPSTASGAGVESGGCEAAGGHDFVDVYKSPFCQKTHSSGAVTGNHIAYYYYSPS